MLPQKGSVYKQGTSFLSYGATERGHANDKNVNKIEKFQKKMTEFRENQLKPKRPSTLTVKELAKKRFPMA